MSKNKKHKGLDLTDRNSRETPEDRANFKEYQKQNRPPKAPYDPSKEIVMQAVAQVPADKAGRVKLHVDLVAYEGKGAWRVRIEKHGTRQDGQPFRTSTIGYLFPKAVLALADAMKEAHDAIPKEHYVE